MKRICWILLLFLLFLPLVACGSQDVTSPNPSGYEAITETDTTAEEEVVEQNYNDLLEYVDSSCFESIGYDDYEEVLYVRFLDSGSVYAYYDVPYSEYDELINADSIGGYYNDYIKGQYECERLE